MSSDLVRARRSASAADAGGAQRSAELSAAAGRVWLMFAVVALSLLDVVDLVVFGVVVPMAAVVGRIGGVASISSTAWPADATR